MFLILLLTSIYNDKLVIFIDETGFNNNLTPIFWYYLLRKKCCTTIPPKSKKISVIAACTSEKLLAFQMLHGNIKHSDFGAFLIRLLSEMKEITDKLNGVVIYCDNAGIHKFPDLQPILSKVNVIYSARYSPFLNQIEEVFGNWKYYFRKRLDTNYSSMDFNIIDAALCIKKKSILGFYKNALKISSNISGRK